MGRQISPERKQEIIDYYNECKSFKLVKEKYGTHRDVLLSWIDPEIARKQREYVNKKLKEKRNDPGWYKEHQSYHKEYQKNNPEKYKTASNKWFDKNKERYVLGGDRYQRKLESEARWRKNSYTPEKKRIQYDKNNLRYNTDPLVRLEVQRRSQLARMIKLSKQGKHCSSVKLLGCSPSEYLRYIENNFLPGMSWDNYGKKEGNWNVDHIIPLYVAKVMPGIGDMLCHYTNTRPLWKSDNLSKGKKYTEEDLKLFIERYKKIIGNQSALI